MIAPLRFVRGGASLVVPGGRPYQNATIMATVRPSTAADWMR